MTAAQRTYLKAEIDHRRRLIARDERADTCAWCGVAIDTASHPNRRFCTGQHRKLWNDRYGLFLPVELRAEPATGRPVHAADVVKRAARRATWRENSRRRILEYKKLVAWHGVPAEWPRWASHLAELRHLDRQEQAA